MEWIKCSERLPPDGVDVWAYHADAMWVDIAWMDDCGCFVFEDYGCDPGEVTHWMEFRKSEGPEEEA